MFAHELLLAAALLSTSFNAPVFNNDASVFAPIGGPPRISLAEKASGDISKSEWAGVTTIELHGCVPDARITALTICIKDCVNKNAFATSTDATITGAMKKMIANLPAGTPFSIEVSVVDAKGKVWEVPDAHYVWRG